MFLKGLSLVVNHVEVCLEFEKCSSSYRYNQEENHAGHCHISFMLSFRNILRIEDLFFIFMLVYVHKLKLGYDHMTFWPRSLSKFEFLI